MVTGASGLGLATAQKLVSPGATVIVVGRDATKCARVATSISSGSAAGAVDWLVADFADQDAVRRLAADAKERYPRIDVLVNNAGASFPKRRLTPEGVELTHAVNHLAPFLLTTLLLDRLRERAPAGSSTSRRWRTSALASSLTTRRWSAATGRSRPTRALQAREPLVHL